MSGVDLGFPEECEPWHLESPHFPSKIGGKPAWLSFKKLPSSEDLKCTTCAQPKIFLCQVYAPYEDCDWNFHRTLFVFACRNPGCHGKNKSDTFSVFRSNLPRRNDYYSFDPPEEDKRITWNMEKWAHLCALCGCAADKNCGKCKMLFYCSREHQVMHWKEVHKAKCCTESAKSDSSLLDNSRHLFPQFELVIEPEGAALDAEKNNDEAAVEEQLHKLQQMQLAGTAGVFADDESVTEEELQRHAALVDEDKTFARFRRRVTRDPDQVLRYERAGAPLWIAKEPQPLPDDIPPCESCKSSRRFEFQVQPQMLAVLKEDAIDFGVLAVFTCAKSCWDGDCYKKEVIFKQDVAD